MKQGHIAGSNGRSRDGRKFYIAGLSYFLLGIIVGTGLWLGWSDWLKIKTPVEVHIHANNWGFLTLVFAGLLVDMYPEWAKRPLAWPRSITPIFWMLTIGALGLVIGPWVKSNWFSVPGIILFLIGTSWLLLSVHVVDHFPHPHCSVVMADHSPGVVGHGKQCCLKRRGTRSRLIGCPTISGII